MPCPDLHLHSTFSDGLLPPGALVARALTLGLPAIAIADHDSVAAVAPALEAARGTGLTVVPAVELSASADGRTVHMRGYFIDHLDAIFLARLASLREGRRARARRIVNALATAGIAIDPDTLALETDQDGAVGRAHIARALIEAGHARDMHDAFDRYLGDGAPFFASKALIQPADAIAWIREAGGVAVLAHPGLNDIDDMLPSLIDAGIVGIEAFHASHAPDTACRYADLAGRYGLIATGGSDFHGSPREGGDMGCAAAPDRAVEALAEAAAHSGGTR